MSLVSCKSCGANISDKAFKCPKCGKAISKAIADTNNHNLKSNSLCTTGFILGIISVFFGTGLLPIITLIISIIGLSKFNNSIHKNKWMGITGVILGVIYTIVYVGRQGGV